MPILSNKIQRTIITLFGISVTFILFAIPYFDYITVKIAYFIVLTLSIVELHSILPKSLQFHSPITAIFVGSFSSILTFLSHYYVFFLYISNVLLNTRTLFFIIMMLVCLHFMAVQKKQDHIFKTIFKCTFFLIYPGTMFSFILSILTIKPYPLLHLYVVVFTVYIADGFSYLTGIILRPKHSMLPSSIHAISPKKTLIGYIGGTVFALYFMFLTRHTEPSLFPFSLSLFVLFAITVIISTFIGDLFESTLKRKLNIKDSGTLMLGRGGVLDSFDSLYFAAPTYYLLYTLFATLFSQ